MLSRLRQMWLQRRNREALYSTAGYWDQKADSCTGKAASMWPNNSLNVLYERELELEIIARLGDLRGLKVLDVGCGTGRLSRWFAARGAEVVGIDFSAGALSVARRETSGNNPRYRNISVFDLADEGAFDVAFTWGVIAMACKDQDQLVDALSRIRRALRDGGRILLAEHIHKGFLHRVLDMDIATFLSVMREAGFEVKAMGPLHFWPSRLLLAYFPLPGWITRPIYELGQRCMRIPLLAGQGDYWSILANPSGQNRSSDKP